MGTITLLLGKTRRRRLQALRAGPLAGLSPFDQAWVSPPSLAPHLRPGEAGFAPRHWTLEGILRDTADRVGLDGAWLPDAATAAIAGELARPLVQAPESPGDPAPGEALARLYTLYREAGAPRLLQTPRADALRSSLRELGRRLAALPHHAHPADALTALLPRLRSPPDALSAWLARSPGVVFEGFTQLSPLRLSLLSALARAWAAAGAAVVICVESGRSLGGDEAGIFFEYDDADDRAWVMKPFQATRSLRRQLFTDLVSTGEATILVAGPERAVEVRAGDGDGGVADPEDLSDRLYERRPLPLADAAAARAWTGERLRVLAAIDPEEELRELARRLKEALVEGASPADCAVGVAGLATHAHRLRGIFRDYGLRPRFDSAVPLSLSPPGRVVRGLVRAALDGSPASGLLPWLAGPLTLDFEELDPAELLRWCRASGAEAGPPAAWSEPVRGWLARTQNYSGMDRLDVSLARLAQIQERLSPLTLHSPPREWLARLDEMLIALELPRRIGRGEDPQLAAENLRAWGALREALAELAESLSLAGGAAWTPEALFARLEAALATPRWRPDPPGLGGIRVVELEALRGGLPRFTWVAGLTRGAFPSFADDPTLLPRDAARALGAPDPAVEARFLLCDLLREGLADPGVSSLTLSWSGASDGRRLPPSPVIQDLLSLPTTREDRALLGDLLVERPRPAGAPLSTPEAQRAAAIRPDDWAHLVGATAFTARQIASVRARAAPAFGPWDGVLERPPSVPSHGLAVTAVETYMRCPARYWYYRGLNLRPPTIWDPELSPDRRGTIFHQILEDFLNDRELAPLEGLTDRDRPRARLHALGARQLDQLSAKGGLDPTLLAWLRERWLAGLVDDAPAGLLRAWLDAEIDGQLGLVPRGVEVRIQPLMLSGVPLIGTVDRIDDIGDGVLVTDYKTGHAPSTRDVRRGLALQPIAYAAAVSRERGAPAASVYYVIHRADDLGRKGWCGDPALLNQLVPSHQRYHSLPLTAAQQQRLLDHAADAVRRMVAGYFHTTLAEPYDAGCRHCDYRRVCRVGQGRNAAVEGDWQRPLPRQERGR